jgi:hypothetical protein
MPRSHVMGGLAGVTLRTDAGSYVWIGTDSSAGRKGSFQCEQPHSARASAARP